MKVCLLNDSFPPVIDGVANVVMNYAKIMTEDGLAEVEVGTPRYPDTDYTGYPYRVVPYQSFDTTKIVKGYRAGNPFVISELKNLADFEPDLIHSHCPVSSTLLARMLRTKTEAPLVFTYHTKFDIDIAKAVKSRLIQEGTIKALVSNIEACDEVWVVSQGAGENLRSLGFEGEYRVVNNGVDFPKGKVSDEKIREACKGYDLPSGLPVFLYVGRIIKYKGIPMILEALGKLKRDGYDFRMVFIGSGPDMDESKEIARQEGLLDSTDGADKAIFVGPIYDRDLLRAWNSRCNLFLFPSTYDTNGIVVREAAACGLASVLIKDSCAAEGITDRGNGFLIEENADSMHNLLLKLCKEPELMKKAGSRAMNEIYISWEQSVKEAHELYGQIIEKKKAGLYTTKRHRFAGNIKEITDDMVLETRALINMPTRIYDDMLDNVEEFKIDMELNTEEFKKLLRENYEDFRIKRANLKKKTYDRLYNMFKF